MRPPFQKYLSLIFLAVLLVSCVSPSGGVSSSGGVQLPSMEIPLRGFSESRPEPTVEIAPTATQAPLPTIPATQLVPELPTLIPTITPLPYPLWIEPSVPDDLRKVALEWNLPVAETESAASLSLRLAEPTDVNTSTWIYALVASFPTTDDGVEIGRAHV